MWKYYYEKMTPMGRWAPQISEDMPSGKSASGHTSKIRNIREIEASDRTMPWRDLTQKYGTPVEPVAARPGFVATHRHKGGGLYRVTAEGRKEVTGDEAYALVEYENAAGDRFAQRAERFHDGRFSPIDVAPSQDQ